MKSLSAELSSRETIHRAAHRKEVTSVAFNSDGTYLAAGGDASTTCVFDVEQQAPFLVSKQHLHECKGHSENIESVAWNPTDPKSFATVGCDRIINTYDLRTGTMPTHTFMAEDKCLNLSWAPDGQCMLVSDEKDKFYKVDTRKWTLEKGLSFGNGEINQFQWNAAGDRLYLARGSGRLSVLRWPSLESLITLDAHVERCYAIAADSGDNFIAVTSDDTTVSVWDARSLVNRFVIDHSECSIRLAAYDHNASILALANEHSGIQLTQASTGSLLCTIPTSAPVNCLHWHPKSQLLAFSLDRPEQRDNRFTSDASPNCNIWGYARPLQG